MVTLFGRQVTLPEWMSQFDNVVGAFLLTVLVWGAVSIFSYLVLNVLLRRLTRHIPGKWDDVVLDVIRGPLVLLITVFGTLNSLEVLGIPEPLLTHLERVFNTVLGIVTAYLAWGVVKDVVMHYGEELASKTESRVDDIIVPILNLVGPLVIVLVAALIMLPWWGVDITSLLVGAGVVGLILGLALQDTLANMFGGISLLVDAPFATRDLIVLADGKLCRVERIGLRVTELNRIEEHSLVYVPNKELANTTVVNVTKPTVDLKVSIVVGVAYRSDMNEVGRLLRRIAAEHPNVILADDNLYRHRKAVLESAALSPCEGQRGAVSSEAERRAMEINSFLARSDAERTIDTYVKELNAILGKTQAALDDALAHGNSPGWPLSVREKLRACRELVDNLRSNDLSKFPDPWAEPGERESEAEQWRRANAMLDKRWSDIEMAILDTRRKGEARLVGIVREFRGWLVTRYKTVPELWKDPQVSFKGFAGSSIDLQLDFYVDNIRYEHFERRQRVVTEIATRIHSEFGRCGIEIPFPQLDIGIRKTAPLAGPGVHTLIPLPGGEGVT